MSIFAQVKAVTQHQHIMLEHKRKDAPKPQQMFSFPKTSRLVTQGDFRYVFKHATTIKGKGMSMFVCPNEQGQARLGIIIAKRQIKHASHRVRVKRQIRESFRQQTRLPSQDIAVYVYANADNMDNRQIRQELERLWTKSQNF